MRSSAGTRGRSAFERRGLQQGEVVLDLVVGGERARDAARQQQVRLAELRNDLLLQRHGTASVVIRSAFGFGLTSPTDRS